MKKTTVTYMNTGTNSKLKADNQTMKKKKKSINKPRDVPKQSIRFVLPY